MMIQGKKFSETLDKIKYPLLVLLLGVGILLIPNPSGREPEPESVEQVLQQTLSHTRGVGETWVAASENGVVVVCQGAGSAQVRLDIIRAVSAYTGFASDRITVLNMAEQVKK